MQVQTKRKMRWVRHMEKEQVNTRLADALIEEIDKRRGPLDKTRGAYLAQIAEWWFAQGAPPVTEFEKRIRERTSARRAS